MDKSVDAQSQTPKKKKRKSKDQRTFKLDEGYDDDNDQVHNNDKSSRIERNL